MSNSLDISKSKAFIPLLKSMACIQCVVSNLSANNSAYSVELMLRDASNLQGKFGNGGSGQVSRWMNGTHVADDRSIKRLIDLFPEVKSIHESPFWKILEGWFPNDSIKQFLIDNLTPSSFWVCYSPFPANPNSRQMTMPRYVIKKTLQRLVIQGTMDSIMALYAATRELQELGKHDLAIKVASYIPVAIALLKRRKPFAYIAEIILCRCRQLLIDNMTSENHKLYLNDYNLVEISNAAPINYPILPNPINPHFYLGPLKSDNTLVEEHVSEWIELNRPPLREVTSNTNQLPKWRNDLFPRNQFAKDSTSHFPLAKKATDAFRIVLADYWEPVPN